jgi:hypothetical protein
MMGMVADLEVASDLAWIGLPMLSAFSGAEMQAS